MIGLVIQIAGLCIGVAFGIYLLNMIKQDKAANQTLLTTIVVLGFGVFIGAEVLLFKTDAAGKVVSSGLLWGIYQLGIKLLTSAADKIVYVPQLIESARMHLHGFVGQVRV